MLAQRHRIRHSYDFARVTRSGVQTRNKNMVIYIAARPKNFSVDTKRVHGSAARFGLIVSKSVGSAVIRNRAKRRLRNLAAQYLDSIPNEHDVVVRALPSIAATSWKKIAADFRRSLEISVAKAKTPKDGHELRTVAIIGANHT